MGPFHSTEKSRTLETGQMVAKVSGKSEICYIFTIFTISTFHPKILRFKSNRTEFPGKKFLKILILYKLFSSPEISQHAAPFAPGNWKAPLIRGNKVGNGVWRKTVSSLRSHDRGFPGPSGAREKHFLPIQPVENYTLLMWF